MLKLWDCPFRKSLILNGDSKWHFQMLAYSLRCPGNACVGPSLVAHTLSLLDHGKLEENYVEMPDIETLIIESRSGSVHAYKTLGNMGRLRFCLWSLSLSNHQMVGIRAKRRLWNPAVD